ncbi:MAG TPA: nuclear transport factor 2 family protein [Povalibacter sp.]
MSSITSVTSGAAFAGESSERHIGGNFLLAAQDVYADDVTWTAPIRELKISGRDAVIDHLRREYAGMHEPEFTFLRRNGNERQMIDEFAVRFVYVGHGLERAPVIAGDLVELKRVRILDVRAGRVTQETCIENWTVLKPVTVRR